MARIPDGTRVKVTDPTYFNEFGNPEINQVTCFVAAALRIDNEGAYYPCPPGDEPEAYHIAPATADYERYWDRTTRQIVQRMPVGIFFTPPAEHVIQINDPNTD